MLASRFQNQKILFIAPKFYHYHRSIKTELESLGAQVTFYPEMEYTLLYRLSRKFNVHQKKQLESRYMTLIVENIQCNDFDMVLVIRGYALTPNIISDMKKKLPQAHFVLYQWDSVEQNNYLNMVNSFDVVKTFDSEDAKKYGLDYYPLFFTNSYADIANSILEKKYALSFFGAYHSDRLEVIKYFDKLFENTNYKFKHHLYITRLALLYRLLNGTIKLSDLKYFKTYFVSNSEIVECYAQSLAVLDVELSIQSGLSMRTFEVLGAGLKLVTTNACIRNEPFFSSNCINIINRNNIQIPLDFFSHNIAYKPSLVENNRLNMWLKNLV
jgi:hypothetical protein